MTHALRTILLRDLDKLLSEIDLFASDDDLWRALPGTTNSPGVLAVHICGNLQHFIGANLGGSGYVRDRDAEFAAHGLSREHVRGEIVRARCAVELAFGAIDEARLGSDYPVEFLGEHATIGGVLAHLSGHMMYHLGQINYARRFSPPASDEH